MVTQSGVAPKRIYKHTHTYTDMSVWVEFTTDWHGWATSEPCARQTNA